MSAEQKPDQAKQREQEQQQELSEKDLDQVAGGRTEITREQWEKLAATNDFVK